MKLRRFSLSIRFPAACVQTVVGIAGAAVALLLTACQEESVPAPEVVVSEAVQPAPAPVPAPVDAAMSDDEVGALLGDLGASPLESASLETQVADILDRYPDKTGTELLQVPEVNRHLVAGLTKLNDRPELKQVLDTTVAVTAELIGLPGEARLDLDMSKYTEDRKARMLTAVLSEDPKQIVDYVANEIGGALPDLYYGQTERAPNGVSIVPKEAPPQ